MSSRRAPADGDRPPNPRPRADRPGRKPDGHPQVRLRGAARAPGHSRTRSSSWTPCSNLPSRARRCWSGSTSTRATLSPRPPGRLRRRDPAEPPRRAAVARPARRVRRGLVHARRPAVLHGHLPPSAGRGDDRRRCRLSVPQGRRSEPLRRAAPAGAPAAEGDALRGRQRHLGRGLRNLLVYARPGTLVHGPRDPAGVLRGAVGPDAPRSGSTGSACSSTRWAIWST